MLDALVGALTPGRTDEDGWRWVPGACENLDVIQERLTASGREELARLAGETAAIGRRIVQIAQEDLADRRAEAFNRQAMLLSSLGDLVEKWAAGDLAAITARLAQGPEALRVVALVALSFALGRGGDLSYVKSVRSAYLGDSKALVGEIKQRAADLASWHQRLGEEPDRALYGLIRWAEPLLVETPALPEARAAIIALYGLIFNSQIRLLRRSALNEQVAESGPNKAVGGSGPGAEVGTGGRP
jgi:hypothetical protein